MSTTVLLERRDAVAILTLNRPEQLNAWNRTMEGAYHDALEELDDDPTVRAIVVTGAGGAFCAGADMADLASASDGSRLASVARDRDFPLHVRKPLIAAVNGPAAGMGLVQALYCDIRFCATSAKLTTVFARRGLVAEFGVSWLLLRTLGRSGALDLLMSGRVVLGEEALRIGLVDRVAADAADTVEDAVAYATGLAESSAPFSMAAMKQQLLADAERTFGASLADSLARMDESLSRSDVREGVASFRERRAPQFSPLDPKEKS